MLFSYKMEIKVTLKNSYMEKREKILVEIFKRGERPYIAKK